MLNLKNILLDLIDLIAPLTLKNLFLVILLAILLWMLAYLLFVSGVILVSLLYIYLILEKRDYYGFNFY